MVQKIQIVIYYNHHLINKWNVLEETYQAWKQIKSLCEELFYASFVLYKGMFNAGLT